MAFVEITFRGLNEAVDRLKEAAPAADRGMKRAVRETANAIATRARSNAARFEDTGAIRVGIGIRFDDGGRRAEVVSTGPGSRDMEFGVRPGRRMPPTAALVAWAERHGLPDAFVVARKIEREGLPARPFLIPAWREEAPHLASRIAQAVESEISR